MNEFICKYKGCVWNNELGCQNDYIHVTLDDNEVIDCKELETPDMTCEYCGSKLTKNMIPTQLVTTVEPTHVVELKCENCGKV